MLVSIFQTFEYGGGERDWTRAAGVHCRVIPIGKVTWEPCFVDRQTDKQTDRQTQLQSLPSHNIVGGWKN